MELNDIQLCYVAALIDGLRLIVEKAADRKIELENKDIDCGALAQYVRVKGDRLVALHFGLRNDPDAVKRMKDIWPKPDNTPFVKIVRWTRTADPTPEQVKQVCELLGQGTRLNKIQTLVGISQGHVRRIRDIMFRRATVTTFANAEVVA